MTNKEYIPAYELDNQGHKFVGAYLFAGEQNSYLLNSQSGCSVLLDNLLADQIRSHEISDRLSFMLVQRGLISHPEYPAPVLEEEIYPTFFIFDLTQACNFRCLYCFRHLEDKAETISDENLDAITSYIIEYCQKTRTRTINIQPWGGEPLIAFDKIKRMDDALKKAGLRPSISIETNASLITDEIAREASARDIRIGISIDGYEAIQNMHRPLMSGAPSFDKTKRGIDIISKYDNLKNFGVVCVLTSKSYPYLADIIEYFGTELKIRCFKLNLIKDNPVMRDAELCLTEQQAEDAQKILIEKLLDLNARGYEITELNVQEKLMNLLLRHNSNICTSRGCMGGTKMIAFDQEGRIFPCDVTDYKDEAIGDVHTGGDLIELVKKAKNEHRDFFNKKVDTKCDDCPYWAFCKGGCTTAIKYKTGKVEGIDRQECAANRSLYPQLIKIILERPEAVTGLTRGRVKIIES